MEIQFNNTFNKKNKDVFLSRKLLQKIGLLSMNII